MSYFKAVTDAVLFTITQLTPAPERSQRDLTHEQSGLMEEGSQQTIDTQEAMDTN